MTRLAALHLKAFGPFTERSLQFERGDSDLHIVYGRNEAGKSATLRALLGMLYGIPARTSDNFLHANTALRIGAELERSGESVSVQRRKGTRNTLLDADGQALAEETLQAYLGGVNRELFTSLFGIDHQRLTAGAQAILEQQGELGQALFAASAGSRALRQVLGQLRDDSDALFKPNGRNPEINRAVSAYRETQDIVRQHSLVGSTWEATTKEIEQLRARSDALRASVNTQTEQLARLQRYQRLLPRFAQRDHVRVQLAAYDGQRELADDFSERRQALADRLLLARRDVDATAERVQRLESERTALDPREDVLAAVEQIEALHAGAGVYREAQRRAPALTTRLNQLDAQLSAQLAAIDPGLTAADLASLQAVLHREQGIAQLAAEFQDLSAEQRLLEQQRDDSEQERGRRQRELAALGEVKTSEALAVAVQHALQAGDLDQTLAETQAQIDAQAATLQTQVARLPGWHRDLSALVEAPLPVRATVTRVRDQFAKLSEQRRHLDAVDDGLRQKARGWEDDVARLQREDHIPQPQDLEVARRERDRVWSEIKSVWRAPPADADNRRDALGADYEQRVQSADAISDRLRYDADRVSQLALGMRELEKIAAERAASTEQRQALAAEQRDADEAWLALWSAADLQPLLPDEMLAWLDEVAAIRQAHDALTAARANQAQVQAQRDRLLQGLKEAGMAVSDASDLKSALQHAKRRQSDEQAQEQALARVRARLTELDDALAKTAQRLAHTARARVDWQAQWASSVEGLPKSLCRDHPQATVEVLRALAKAVTVSDKRADVQHDLAEHTRECAALPEALDALPDAIQALATEREPFAQVHALYRVMQQHQQWHEQDAALMVQYAEAQDRLRDQQRELDGVEHQMQALLADAGCDNIAAIAEVEKASTQIKALRRRLQDIERDILADGGGDDLATLDAAVKGYEPAALVSEIDRCQQSLADLEPELQKTLQDLGARQRDLETMQGGDAATQAAEEAASQASLMGNRAREYLRVKIASRLLADELERFRQKHQGPMLENASGYFKDLTLGSFERLTTDYNAQDKPVLLAMRDDGQGVHVEGMSNGTRDQLYLALRLAALDRFIAQHGAMPFIIDDILIEFDDVRSEAALALFSAFSARTQVIVFTHHQRVVELAERLSQAPSIIEL
ncbi:MAG TPA: hypothetical protein DD979_11890 [Gammaproteobacteria bacterium]|nr:hypothetical protein [Gammaproteobacteria bacterium]